MMKFDIAETAFALIMCALLCGGGFYIHTLKSRLADEVDARQAADARAAVCEASARAAAAQAKAREAAASAALRQAQRDAKSAALRADYELKRAADYPGDDCASAKSRAARWLGERGAAK